MLNNKDLSYAYDWEFDWDQDLLQVKTPSRSQSGHNSLIKEDDHSVTKKEMQQNHESDESPYLNKDVRTEFDLKLEDLLGRMDVAFQNMVISPEDEVGIHYYINTKKI